MMALRHGFAGRTKILLLAIVVVLATLVLTQDGQPVGASHAEIYFTLDTADPIRVGNIVTSPTSKPIIIHIWAKDPHDPVWGSGIGAFNVEVRFNPLIVVASASEVPFAPDFDQCTNAVDDDPVFNFDGFVNDGCPQVGAVPETGAQCVSGNAIDDDGDGVINDGCPAQGSPIEVGVNGRSQWLGQNGRAVFCSAGLVGPVSDADPNGTWRATISCATFEVPPPLGVTTSGLLATLRFVGGTQINFHNLVNDTFLSTTGIVVPTVGTPEINMCTDPLHRTEDSDDDGVISDGCPVVGRPEFDQCLGDDDEDGDSFANDGCPTVGTNVEVACIGADDDDGDGRINDGCPQEGATAETGAQCLNDINDDAADDERVNDGCPAFGDPFESGAQCAIGNIDDEDNDGAVNDGCPTVGTAENAMFSLCTNAIDDDADGLINDGCPAVGPAEFDQCGGLENLGPGYLVDDDGDGAVDDGCAIGTEEIPATRFALQIRLAKCADLSDDGVVAFTDFLHLLQHFGEVPSSPGWNPDIDLTDDGAVAFSDFLAVLGQFASFC